MTGLGDLGAQPARGREVDTREEEEAPGLLEAGPEPTELLELINLEVINQTMYAVLKTAINAHLHIKIYCKSAQTTNCV